MNGNRPLILQILKQIITFGMRWLVHWSSKGSTTKYEQPPKIGGGYHEISKGSFESGGPITDGILYTDNYI